MPPSDNESSTVKPGPAPSGSATAAPPNGVAGANGTAPRAPSPLPRASGVAPPPRPSAPVGPGAPRPPSPSIAGIAARPSSTSGSYPAAKPSTTSGSYPAAKPAGSSGIGAPKAASASGAVPAAKPSAPGAVPPPRPPQPSSAGISAPPLALAATVAQDPPEPPKLGLHGTLAMESSSTSALLADAAAIAQQSSKDPARISALPPQPTGPSGTVQMDGSSAANVRAEAAAIAAARAAQHAHDGAVPATTSPSDLGRGSMPSDPGLRDVIDQIGRRVGSPDPEQSLEIPPPQKIEASEDEDAKDPYIGTTFDHRYKIEELLGEGGMGFVYRARHKVIDKKIAVKVLRADLARDAEITDRFRQEARAASSIGNPHIIDISDFGDLPDGSTYFVMEFLDGKSLASLIDGKSELTVERICHIASQIGEGLDAAHQAGIVHRDLKPDNIFLITRGPDKDFVKILDFGIAKVTNDGANKLTKAGAVFGTPHYMSPEQAAGATIDHRTDIYSLGVIMYEMTSGQLPFNADNFMGILTQHMYKAPVPIRALVPVPDRPTIECPPALEAVILKCMSKKPEQRYQTMGELVLDLQKVKEGGVPAAVGEMMARSGGFNVPADYFKHPQTSLVPATPPEPVRKMSRAVWVAGAVTAVAIVGGIFAFASMGAGSTGSGVTTVTTATASETTSTPPPPVTAPATTPPPAPKMITVLIDSDPSKGTATVDGKTIQLPDNVQVEEGKTLSVEINKPGYQPTTVELDGKKTKETIKLKPLKGGAGAATKPTSTGPAVVDPWATKPKKK
ncbi:MAG: protein kinase [Polyangiaceae bacterium]